MPSQYVILPNDDVDTSDASGGSGGIGGGGGASLNGCISPRSELLDSLAAHNTAPSKPGEDVLYGPGYRIELAPEQDPVTQMLVTIDDEDIGWTVLLRLARKFNWKLLDPMTGRELRLSS